jgi:hypothetical protein
MTMSAKRKAAPAPPGSQQRLSPGFLRGFLAGTLLLPVGFGIARATEERQIPAPSRAAAPRTAAPEQPAAVSRQIPRSLPAAKVLVEAPAPRREADAVERHAAHASQVLVGDFRSRIRAERNRLNAMAGDRPVAAETVANTLQPYLTGWIDAVRRAAPELAPQLMIDVGEALCAKDTSDEELIALARVSAAMPSMLDSTSIDCVLASRPKEDIVVWTMLDAWAQSGMARTEQVEALAQRATDARTRERLKPLAERNAEAIARQESAPSDIRAYDGLGR